MFHIQAVQMDVVWLQLSNLRCYRNMKWVFNELSSVVVQIFKS